MAFSFCRSFIFCIVMVTIVTGCAHKPELKSNLMVEEMKEQFKKDTKDKILLEMFSGEYEKNFNGSAMSMIGSIYLTGQHDVKKDIEKYKKWMMLAADYGSPFALQEMGNNYRYGHHGFDKNPRLAVLYYRACTGSFLRQCHFPLGKMYRDGAIEYGVLPDKGMAFHHLYMAIDTGNDSKKMFRDFYHSLTPKEKRTGMFTVCDMLDIEDKRCFKALKPKMDIALKDIQETSPPPRR